MAKPHDVPDQHRGLTDTVYTCVDPDRRNEALSVLLTGRATEPIPPIGAFLETVQDPQQLLRDGLWAAYQDQVPVAAVMVVPNPGRTAMLFICPVQDRGRVVTTGRLVRVACEQQNPNEIRLVQALMEAGQKLEIDALVRGGFTELAHLLYMSRGLDRAGLSPFSLDASLHPLRFITWQPAYRELFAGAILSSYENTLDCPRLVGKRDIDDIIAGHMATGRFLPQLWRALLDEGDRPVAVMLLNRVPHTRAVELVYLGIAPPWRGKGLGRRLLAHGLQASIEHGVDEILLAVDEANTPAVRLYRSMWFKPKARKLALMFELPVATQA